MAIRGPEDPMLAEMLRRVKRLERFGMIIRSFSPGVRFSNGVIDFHLPDDNTWRLVDQWLAELTKLKRELKKLGKKA